MKVLIVDDEVIVRTGLSTVINWKELGLTFLPPAASAEEALERIPSEKPDILLTDIRMTGKNGLELSKAINEQFPDMEIIILTGYDDFLYAQEAIRSGINDYLLKTSGPEEIIKAMASAKRRILERRKAARHDLIQQRESRNHLFEKLITVKINDDEILDQCKRALTKIGSQVDHLYVLIISANGWGNHEEENNLLHFSVSNMLEEVLQAETLLKKDRIIAIVNNGALDDFKFKIRSVTHKIEQLLKCDIFVACSAPVEKLIDISSAYQEANHVFQFKEILNGTGYYTFDEIIKRKGGRTVCSHEEENELGAILLNNDRVALQRWVNQKVQEQLANPEVTFASFTEYFKSIQIAGYRWLERASSSTGVESPFKLANNNPPKINEQDSHAVKLYKHLTHIMKNYHENLSEDRSSLIQKAITYVKGHLGKEASLQQVASFIHISPTYFSEIFKQETGMTFGEFLTQERMKKAAELLESSPAKITEISSKVGYEDTKYFGKLFKKHMGMTPSEYREKFKEKGKR